MKDKKRLEKIGNMCCIVCERVLGIDDSPAEVHHLIGYGVGLKAPDSATIPLCPQHHRIGARGVAIHATPLNAWEDKWGTQEDLLEVVNQRLGLVE